MKRHAAIALSLFICVLVSVSSNAQQLDIAIIGGRVMDLETGLDAIRNVGIQDGTIVSITQEPIDAKRSINAKGLVVSPGFIDLHAHGQNAESRILQAGDGVTTALELEIGVYPVAPWYASQEGTSIINYGATASHLSARAKLFNGVDFGHSATAPPEKRMQVANGDYANKLSTDEDIEALKNMLRQGLEDGALGLGFGIAYTPNASHKEIYETFSVAKEFGVTVFVHMRAGSAFATEDTVGSLQEVIANAVASGISLHVVHMGSSGGDNAKVCMEILRSVRAKGFDITTEVYPWNAGSTRIESALFANLEEDYDYSQLMWTPTGERLTKETFDKYRAQGGWVIIFSQKEENVAWLVAQPDVIIASDGIPFVNGMAHPRGSGTFARVLGKYVREDEGLSLMQALTKMTLMPAQRLESITDQMKRKGRIQIGMDADITIFDPTTVRERATFTEPAQYSKGIQYVLVNGVLIVEENRPLENVFPGQAIRANMD
jgi:N-acyl-D-aspartate/D-glutamate deacylase